MDKYVKWQNKSYSTIGKNWIPEAKVDILEGDIVTSQPIFLSDTDYEKIKHGNLIYSTPEQAKVKAHEMVKNTVWDNWKIPEASIQEY